MPRTQVKLVAALAAVVLAVVLLSGYLAERGLRQREHERLVGSLRERAALVRELIGERRLAAADEGALQALAERAAAAAEARVTLFGPDGRVLADSARRPEGSPPSEEPLPAPELERALAGEVGVATRRRGSRGRRLLYVALPEAEGRGGAVRLAVDHGSVEAEVAALRRTLAVAGAAGLGVALLLSYGLAGLVLRPVRELRHVVASIAGGDLDRRLPWHSQDELGEIAEALGRVGAQLRGRLREVTAEKEQLQAVLQGMVEGVLVVDREQRVLLANPRLRELFDAWGAVRERPAMEVIRRAEVESALVRTAETGEPVVREIALAGPEERILEMHAVRFPASGELLGSVAVFHDVTELRRLERVRQEFVANVSHELKTPLTAIQGFAETLRGASVPEEQRARYAEVILRHAERLARLIDDILELSRIERGRQLPMERTEVAVRDVAELVLRDLAPQLEARSLQAELDCAGSPVAWADRRAVEQTLTNLLDNAVKYTERGGRIALRIREEAHQVRVAVSDTGIGIPPADRPRIFERFYRVDKARSRDLGGTGLGLSIVKHLVQAMGGEVYVDSEPGKGSTFTFLLPRVAPAHGPGEGEASGGEA